ncbi:flagellar hook-associated protein FlgK [Paludibacterium denitrificans]|uniref:flagellar hook-associated protein FlgK n=1 Tax=Paludibacterium denitrificans TaxID=2675226 RepID=UPI001E356CC1|nr:flagellar hook-associated protein FlgK [Paludibacterium denitrificans]
MGSSIFSIGVSGLNAAQTALSVVGHNIANVNTVSYTRQSISQAARLPQDMGFGFVGKGVDVTQVARSYDQYLDKQVLNAQTNSNYYSSQVSQLNQINNLLADSSVGLTPALQDFFGSLQTLTQDPSSIPSRQTVINMSQALATKFRTIDSRLQEITSGTNGQIASTVDSINAIADKIAGLNSQIAAMTGGQQDSVPNDLLDQRDNAMQELNKLVKAKAVTQSDGTYTVFIGNGQSLILGNTVTHLATQKDPADPTSLQLVYPNANGTNTLIPNNLIDGGDLGGLLNFRDGALLSTRQQLGTLAIDFSTAMNYQHELGRDLSGQQGGALFNDLTSYASHPQDAAGNLQVLLSDPSKLAVSSSLQLDTTAGGITPSSSGVSLSGAWASVPVVMVGLALLRRQM